MFTPFFFFFYYSKKNEVITFTIHVLIDLILLERGIHLSKANDSTNPFPLLIIGISFSGWGTDERALISILGHRNANQRKLIGLAYEEVYQEDLIQQLKCELSGDFEVYIPQKLSI